MRFGTVLVANRGEIAVRVLRAARAAGLRTVAVYSDADREAPHVREADTAVRLGPAPASESYLNIDAILAAARRTGAEAVHPGYGFLSERAAFARAVTDAGLVFIGPSAEVIEVMGRKDEARKIAIAADVPVVPSVDLPASGASAQSRREDAPGVPRGEIAQALQDVPYPLLVKAAAGGGGKGMRIVREPSELDDALASARREAASAFGDDTLLVERYVEHGRHVEVQVLGDEHGRVLHLFERDCSTQRRHQKVLEEAPAPTIGEGVRERLTAAAVRLAEQVGYVNAGTVEFLVAGEELYFLEMNTRLQVEHPVTELVTGLDIVGLQLRVAQGLPLPMTQDEVRLRGHAIEARVYAEDPYAGFLPQAGIASTVAWPSNARVDAALEPGQPVGTAYDPMLGKVIVHGATREAARGQLLQALDDTAVLGLTTNVGFLRQLAASDAFRDCRIDTGWLDQHLDAFVREEPPEALCIAAWQLAHVSAAADPTHPFGAGDGWRLGAPAAPVPVELGTEVVTVDRAAGVVHTGEHRWQVRPVAGQPGLLRLEIDGVIHEAHVEIDAHTVTVGYLGQPHVFTRPDAFGPAGEHALSDGSVAAPMPGTLLAVSTSPGDTVAAGETLGVMEAMKMELALKAPYDGVVREVNAVPGEQVALGHTLFVVDRTEEG
ncbi:MAG: ATP-grasp domain-containing protein [Actinomycetota bacterium]|nr:ATP-grasp domain-containing protein [Actinomycetota bacterium]